MQYKTMILELLLQRPQIHDLLCRHRILLPTLEGYAQTLQTRHDLWKEQLRQTKPDSDEIQIASEALEIALQEIQDYLPTESPQDQEPLSLESAMAYVRRHTPPV